MIVVCQAVRRGVQRALLSCDFPFGPVQEGSKSAVRAAIRFVKEAGVDMVKLDGASDHLDAVTAVTRAGIPVFAQFGITPQTALKYGVTYSATPTPAMSSPMRCSMKSSARQSVSRMRAPRCSTSPTPGPLVGAAVAQAVSIPVVGGFGGGPWLDGRIRMATAAIGYSADALDIAAGHLRQRRADRASTRSSPTPTTCGQRARSRADSGDERVHGGGGRHRHPLRGGGLGSAAADVLAGWLQRHPGQLGNTRPVSTHPHVGAAAGTVHLHHLRQTRVRAARAVGWSGCAGRTTSTRASGCSTIWATGASTSWAACVGCSIATLLATTHRDRVAGMVLYSPAGGPKYRRKQHARFAAHLAYVAEHGLAGVAALARATEAGFSDDGRVGPVGVGAAQRRRIRGALRRIGRGPLPDDRRRA